MHWLLHHWLLHGLLHRLLHRLLGDKLLLRDSLVGNCLSRLLIHHTRLHILNVDANGSLTILMVNQILTHDLSFSRPLFPHVTHDANNRGNGGDAAAQGDSDVDTDDEGDSRATSVIVIVIVVVIVIELFRLCLSVI